MYRIDLNTEILARSKNYELIRDTEGRIFITVYEVLAGDTASPFVAYPNTKVKTADNSFWAGGNTEDEALSACLKKIKGVPFNELFPKG